MLPSFRWMQLLAILSATWMIAGCGGGTKPEVSKAQSEQEAREQRVAQYDEQIQLGKAHLQAKRFSDAEEAFHKADLIQPNDELVREWQAKTKLAKNEALEADFLGFMQAGSSALQKSDYAAADAAFRRALQLKPTDPVAGSQSREAECLLNVQVGRQAMAERRFSDALRAFGRSAQIKPEDRDIQLLVRQAQTANLAMVRAEYDKALAEGRQRLAAKDYQPALDAFDRAQRLMPGQADFAALRADAEFSLQFDRGRRYFEEKRYAEAKSALETACRVRPSDVVAAGLLQQAQRMMQGQLRADFDQALAAGKTALVAARYVEAIAAFQQARRIFPNDQDAANLLSQAEQGKKKAEFDQFIGQGKRALASARYVEAIGSFKEAQRILPENRDAANLIAEAERSKRKAEFDQFLGDGRRLLANGRYAEAIGSFKEAQRIFPDDKETARLLADADNRKRRADYDKAMSAGKGALSAHRVLAAIAAFKEAKQALPQDLEAARLLREAESVKRDYDTQIAKGRTALTAGKFDAALEAFRAATALVVDEPEAARLTRDAQNRKECAGLVSKGKLAMSQNRFADAVDAFTTAVKLVPGGEAQALLKQAEARKKEEDRKNKKGR